MSDGVILRENFYNGVYYPTNNQEIIYSIKNFFKIIQQSDKNKKKLDDIGNSILNKKILSFIVPHGAYYYSGLVSAFVYYLIGMIDCKNYILLSSDHNGTSPGISIMNKGFWKTPLGNIEVDDHLALKLSNNSRDNFISIDPYSLSIDYTIETHLPFLQYVNKDFKFLPILQKNQDKSSSIKLAELIYASVRDEEKIVLIATSNLTHYLNYDECYQKDEEFLSSILSFDIDSMYNNLDKNSLLNICGFGCIATAMHFSKLGKNLDVFLLNHSTSGDIDGNKSAVVGYGSLLIS